MKTVMASQAMKEEMERVMDEVATAIRPIPPPNGFTLADFMARTGLPRNAARDGLNRQVQAGKLIMTRVLMGGHNVCIWSPSPKT